MAVPSNLVPTRITQLPPAVVPLSGFEQVPLVQDGNTRQVTVSALLSTLTISSLSGVPDTRLVSTITGQLVGGGALSADLDLGLAATTVSAGAYGSASAVPRVTYDQFGRATAASNVLITPAAIGAVPITTQVIAGANLVGGGPLSGDVTLNVSSTMVNQNISGGVLSGVTLSGATYSGETLSGATIINSTFSGGTVRGTTISGATLLFSTFSGGTVSGSTVRGSTVTGGTADAIVIGLNAPASGYFTQVSATTFSGALSGNAVTATRLATARNFSITSTIGLSSTLVSFSGDANVSLVLTGPSSISGGGTGATDAPTARSNLSVYSQQETLIFAVALG